MPWECSENKNDALKLASMTIYWKMRKVVTYDM